MASRDVLEQLGLVAQHDAEDREGQRDRREDREEGEVGDAAGEQVAAVVAVALPGPPGGGRLRAGPTSALERLHRRPASSVEASAPGATRRRCRARRGGSPSTSKVHSKSARSVEGAVERVVRHVVGHRHVRVVREVERRARSGPRRIARSSTSQSPTPARDLDEHHRRDRPERAGAGAGASRTGAVRRGHRRRCFSTSARSLGVDRRSAAAA